MRAAEDHQRGPDDGRSVLRARPRRVRRARLAPVHVARVEIDEVVEALAARDAPHHEELIANELRHVARARLWREPRHLELIPLPGDRVETVHVTKGCLKVVVSGES